LALGVFCANAQAQQQQSNRLRDRQVSGTLQRLEQSTNRYRNSLNLALVNARIDETRPQNDINSFEPSFSSALDRFKEGFDRHTATAGDVQDVLQKASIVDGFMRRNRLSLQTQNDWTSVRTELNALAKASQTASGTVAGDATLEGSGGIATLKGKGQVQVKGCRVTHAPLMSLLAVVLRLPELAHPDFDECRATFTVGEGRLVNPSLSLKGPSLQLTGQGVTNLESLAIDYTMTLALGETLAEEGSTRRIDQSSCVSRARWAGPG